MDKKFKREVNDIRLNNCSSSSTDMSKLESNMGNDGFSEVKVDFLAGDRAESSSSVFNYQEKSINKLLVEAADFKTELEYQESDSRMLCTESTGYREGMMGKLPFSKLEQLLQERVKIVIELTHQLMESRSKVEVLMSKNASLKKQRVIKQKRCLSHLINFEYKVRKIKQEDDQWMAGLGRLAKLKDTFSNKANETEDIDCKLKGSVLGNTSVDKSTNAVIISEPVGLNMGDDLTELRSRLISGSRNIEKMLNNIKRFTDSRKERLYQPFPIGQEKSVALFTIILKIISSCLELIISLTLESYHLELIEIVKNKDAEQVINNIYEGVQNMCHQCLICLIVLKDYSPTDVKVIVGIIKDLKKASVLTKKKSNNLSVTLSMIESSSETFEHIGHLLQDIQFANFQNITVESRVLVQKKLWCLVKWCPSYSRSNDEVKDPSYHKRFWVSQTNFVK